MIPKDILFNVKRKYLFLFYFWVFYILTKLLNNIKEFFYMILFQLIFFRVFRQRILLRYFPGIVRTHVETLTKSFLTFSNQTLKKIFKMLITLCCYIK